MAWWSWIILGLALLGLELALPGGFFLVFFGISGLILGSCLLIVPQIEIWVQWIIFSSVAVLLLLSFRRRLIQALSSKASHDVDSLVNQFVEVTSDIDVGKASEVTFRGSSWKAINGGSSKLIAGTRARVVSVEGVVLTLS